MKVILSYGIEWEEFDYARTNEDFNELFCTLLGVEKKHDKYGELPDYYPDYIPLSHEQILKIKTNEKLIKFIEDLGDSFMKSARFEIFNIPDNCTDWDILNDTYKIDYEDTASDDVLIYVVDGKINIYNTHR